MESQPMKSRLLTGIALTLLIAGAGTAMAAEPYLQFVQGLRDLRYYDYALLYLDQIAEKATTPAEIKQVIPYQKAVILQESASIIRSPEKQLEQLNQAEAYLEQFVKENPNHPSAADANSDRAAIMLNKGKAEVLQSKLPSNLGAKRDLQNKARETLAKARAVFQTAYDQHDANFKKYPVFIDQVKDPDQFAARSKVETNLITASLNLAMCTYEEAQSHDAGSNDQQQLLTKAADEFEKLHQKYRSQIGGLFARAYQGKCFEEQRDPQSIQKAMGIYNEILEHPGDSPMLSELKTRTLYFKLIVLNSKERHDHQLVVDMAEEWTKKHPGEAHSQMGLSIQWEQARAYEALGDNRELLKADQERFWKLARNEAMQIQKFPSEFKDVSIAMVQRLQVKLGGKEKAPNDFDTAFGLGSQSFSAAQDITKEIDDAIKTKREKEEIDKLRLDRENELNEAGRNFELALSLVKPSDDKKSVLKARLWFAYVNFWLHKNYEAAVLGQFVARTADKDDATLGLDAAYIAMAAFVQAFNENKAPNDQKSEDMRLIIKASNLIADRWPSSDKANEANMMLGKMFSAQKKPAEAAKFFVKIPESDPKYADAQMAAGQAYWTAYVGSGRLTGADKPTPELLAAWLKSAQDHLQTGIDKIIKGIPKEGKAPPDLIAGKMSLAQLMISQGKDVDALKLLVDDPHSVIKAVAVSDETQRPETGSITSRKFALETYKLVLRAYIGTGNLDKARETMKKLEEIAAAGGVEGGSEVTELYVGLGRLLKDELERFRANGETERFDKLMTSFETFLNDMASRKDGQTFGSLSWIGETFYALGETVSSDAAKANSFYEKAGNAFGEILTRATADPTFASSMQMYGVKLRQISVLRVKKEFPPAETLMLEVLKDNPNDLRVQTSAAELYQDWGSSGQADSIKKLLISVYGTTKARTPGNMWGWSLIASKLQKSPDFATNPGYLENFLNARYHATVCRVRYAREQSVKEKQKQLESCVAELTVVATITKDIPEEQFAKLNGLYREVLADLGQPIVDLQRSKDLPVTAPVKPESPTMDPGANTSGGSTVPGKSVPEPPKPPPGIDMMTWIIFISCIVLGVASIVWVLLKGKSKPKPKKYGGSAEPVSFAGINVGESPAPISFPPSKPKPRPAATATSAGAATAAKPATKPAAKPAAPGTAAAAPKPKPKPPSPPAT